MGSMGGLLGMFLFGVLFGAGFLLVSRFVGKGRSA